MTHGSKPAFASAIIAAALLVGGCDDSQHQADKKVQSDLSEARQFALSQDAAQEHSKLEEAAGNTDASPGVHAQAKAALAEAEFEVGRNTAAKIGRADVTLARTLWEISQLADQIRAGNMSVAGYRKYDPKPAREAIAARIEQAAGGADKPAWFTHDHSTIPTLDAANKEIARLQGELTQRNEQLTNLTQQRTRLMDEAEQSLAQSDQLKGDKAIEPFKHASDLRKQAGDIAVQIDTLKSEIAQRNAALAVAQGQKTAASDVISQLNDQLAAIEKAWKELDSQEASNQKLSAAILGSGATAAPDEAAAAAAAVAGSISQKASVIENLVKEIQKLRADAVTSITNASKYYDEAYTSASQMGVDLKTRISDPNNAKRPEVDAWKNMVKVLEPMQYRLQQASVQRTLGDLYTSEVVSLSDRISLRDSLQKSLRNAGLVVPATLSAGELEQDRKTAIANGEAAYKASDDALSAIVDGVAPEEMRVSARIGRALTFYEWAQLARVSGDETTALTRIGSAARERNTAAEANLALVPVMPSELGPIPKPAAPASEPAPAETPATPTDAAAPATAPADAATTAPAADATTAPADAPKPDAAATPPADAAPPAQ
ncbi:MAG TPA: hypothetical protein VHD56_14680 [Tepidisphaeraceae bacterium]|nr:hypothetical protein [Tepidisphaeraceae bacterium]